jgi:hypothetical protein
LAPCPSPLLWCAFSIPPPLLCASFQFTVYCSVFVLFYLCQEWGGSVCPGSYAGLSQGWLGEYYVMLGAHLFGMLNVSQAGLELLSDSWEPSCFFSVMWCGEAFCGLGVQGVEVLILLSSLFLQSVAPASQQGFWFMELTLSASAP